MVKEMLTVSIKWEHIDHPTLLEDDRWLAVPWMPKFGAKSGVFGVHGRKMLGHVLPSSFGIYLHPVVIRLERHVKDHDLHVSVVGRVPGPIDDLKAQTKGSFVLQSICGDWLGVHCI